MMLSTVCSRSPEAILYFTTNTAITVLPLSTKRIKTLLRYRQKPLPPLYEFIANVFQRSKVPPCVCLVSLIYLQRLKSCLPTHACGELDTPYRLFLAAVLTASKFLSEAGACLTSQAMVTMTDYVYTVKDINLMERSFLGLIKYDLFVNTEAIKDYLAIHGKSLEMDLVENTD
ncbi:cyclin domain-containing protein [Sporodiniella umbellata]|nr:cyclin domain-containing protein [Sporodiniella umbellata]